MNTTLATKNINTIHPILSHQHLHVTLYGLYTYTNSSCIVFSSPLVDNLLIPPLHEVAHLGGARQHRRRDLPHRACFLLWWQRTSRRRRRFHRSCNCVCCRIPGISVWFYRSVAFVIVRKKTPQVVPGSSLTASTVKRLYNRLAWGICSSHLFTLSDSIQVCFPSATLVDPDIHTGPPLPAGGCQSLTLPLEEPKKRRQLQCSWTPI